MRRDGGWFRSRTFLVLCAAIGFVPSLVFADWRDFVPTPFENGAFLESFTSFERDHVSTEGTQPVHWTDTFLREKFTLFSDGYSYHPRFLQYHFSIGGSTGWQNASGLEYDTKLLFLPEHAYNLEVFARRYEPLYKEQAATQHNSVEESQGASFRYRQKPYFLHTGVVHDSVTSDEITSDITRFSLDGQYFKRFVSGNEVSFNGAFNPSWFSSSQGLSGSSTEYLAGNFINLQPLRLSSSVAKNTFDQEGTPSGRFENDQLSWYELLNAYLPWNFRSDLSYRYQDNDATIQGATPGSQVLSDTQKNLQFNLVHRLYQSLDTTYTLLSDWRNSIGGDSTSLSNALTLNYTKVIPWGRLLAGASVSRTDTDNHGQPETVNEAHSSTVPGSFTLTQQPQSVVGTNLTVILQCPVAPFAQILLTSPDNYQVFLSGNTVRIFVTSVPPECTLPNPTAQYPFLVSYALASGTFELRTDTFAGNTSAQLFNDLLTPYFSYVTVRSSVLSGTFPGVPIDSNTYTTGLIGHYDPLRVRGEYQQLDWNISPYQQWLGEVQYSRPLDDTTTAYATADYVNKYYPHGTSAYSPGPFVSHSGAFTEQTESVSGSVQKQLLARNMSVSLGGSYARLQGLVDSNAYAVNAAWVWRIGKVDVTAGGSVYGSDSSGGGTLSTSRDHQFFYLNFRRRLF
jgi:hypothetical protein